uniref:SCP domain-containing protein n=1 Tax=Strongyloides papillosus TaxID=174720 RepID=A0A0N5BDA3_STREA
MNQLLFTCYFLFLLAIKSICQTFNVKKIYLPGGGVKYQYNGRTYNSLEEITNEISGGNPNMKFVTQYSTNGQNNNGGYYPYQSKGNAINNVYNGYNSYSPNGRNPPNSFVGYKPYQPNGNTISNINNGGRPYQPSVNSIYNGYGNGVGNGPYGPTNQNNINNRFPPNPNSPNIYTSNGYSDQIWNLVWKGYDYRLDLQRGFSEFKKRALDEHNYYRKNHNVPSLSYDSTFLEPKAQAYAEYLAKSNTFKHDPNNGRLGTGENLAMASPSKIHHMVKAWYDESKKYDFTKNKYTPGLGHFTQIVWKSTVKVGCGLSSNNRAIYLVCKYSPPGNVGPSYNGYVFPPRNKL